MGQNMVTQSSQVITPDIDMFLTRNYPLLRYKKLINDGIMIKSSRVETEDEIPLVLKIYFKLDFKNVDQRLFNKVLGRMEEISTKIQEGQIYNIAPNIKVEKLERAIFVIRQYYAHNLKERVYLMPYLSQIEKIWISIQILFALRALHSNKICHGDLKMENVLLTSNGSVFLSDIAPYKPAYLLSDDLSGYTYYFGSNKETIKYCNLAPERLVDKTEIEKKIKSDELYDLTPKMDIFSAGCVIAGLFIDEGLLDYSKLLDFKKGMYSIENILKDKIPNEKLRFIIGRMVEKDKDKRASLEECIEYFIKEICPITITGMLIHFNTLVTTTKFWKPDMIIGALYMHWNQIWKLLFGLKENPPQLKRKLNFSTVNKLILTHGFQHFDESNAERISPEKQELFKGFDLLIDTKDLTKLIGEEQLDEKVFNEKSNSECLVIFIRLILNNLSYCKYETNKIAALEMLKIFSSKVSDLFKLQDIVPYFVSNLDKTNNLTRLTALHYLIEILYSVDDKNLILPSSDCGIFDYFIFPSILNMYYSEDKDHTLTLEFTNILDKLIDLEVIFLNVAHRSRLEKRKEQGHQGQKISVEEIFQKYDQQLEDFKNKLFPVLGELTSKIDEIDVTQTLIRKLPSLLVFYGKRKAEEFTQFIITNFNKKGWIIQKEILKYIPQMMKTLGEEAFSMFLLPCMEGLISNNINEHMIYQLILGIEKLYEAEYLSSLQAVSFLKVILPLIVHPNILVRNKLLNFLSFIVGKLSPVQVFTNLYDKIKDYLEISVITLTPEIIKDFVVDRITRVAFEMELGEIEECQFNTWPEKIKEKYHDIFEIEKMNLVNPEYSDGSSLTRNFGGSLAAFKLKLSQIQLTLAKPLKKEYDFFSSKTPGEFPATLEKVFFGKIMWFGDSFVGYNLPNMHGNEALNFKESNYNLLSQDQFKLKYLIKTLDISFKLVCINDMFEMKEKAPSAIRSIDDDSEINNYYFNKNYVSWRPTGQIITTLYDHNKVPVERIIPTESNKFASFDSEGNAIVWGIICGRDNTYYTKKEGVYKPEEPCHISYNQTISSIDETNFMFASGNTLYFYGNSSKKSFSDKGKDITCTLPIGKKSEENQKIVFCNQDGRLNIFDQRVAKVALRCNLPIERGIVSCMVSENDEIIHLGTLGGFIMDYDIRLNSITQSFRYNDNTPIIGMSTFRPFRDKSKEYELYSLSENPRYNRYLTIWTGAQDHEVVLWNLNTYNCDALFKVNTIYGTDVNPLTVEIPSIIKEEERKAKSKKSILEDMFSDLSKYTYKFNNNLIKRALQSNISEEFYVSTGKRLTKIINLFEAPTTVQRVFSPFCNYDNSYQNSSFFISAGNDMTIRYWDITKDSEKKSFLVNAPCKITSCTFNKTIFDNTIILQSNETFDMKTPKKDSQWLSEYQNCNGTALHTMIQNEFDSSMEHLSYATRIADAAHKSVITDIAPISIEYGNGFNNFLVSSSWDGTIKIWK